jgi:hypothetical protein
MDTTSQAAPTQVDVAVLLLVVADMIAKPFT